MSFQVDLFPFCQLLCWLALKECQLRKKWKEMWMVWKRGGWWCHHMCKRWHRAGQKAWHPAGHHTCTRVSSSDDLVKNIKNGSNLGKNDAIDECAKNVLFIFDAEHRNCNWWHFVLFLILFYRFLMSFQVDLFHFFQLLFWFALKECQLRKKWKEM